MKYFFVSQLYLHINTINTIVWQILAMLSSQGPIGIVYLIKKLCYYFCAVVNFKTSSFNSSISILAIVDLQSLLLRKLLIALLNVV